MATLVESFLFKFTVVFLWLPGFTQPLLREPEQFFMFVVVICCEISSTVSFQDGFTLKLPLKLPVSCFSVFKVGQQQQLINSRRSNAQKFVVRESLVILGLLGILLFPAPYYSKLKNEAF